MPPSWKRSTPNIWRTPTPSIRSWQAYFASLGEQGLTPTQLGRGPAWRRDRKASLSARTISPARSTGEPAPPAKPAPAKAAPRRPENARAVAQDSIRAIQLVRAYRVIGHLEADLDPLKIIAAASRIRSSIPPSTASMTRRWTSRSSSTACWAWKRATPRQMVDLLKRTYCGRIGYEFMHINDAEQKDWLQRRIEGPDKEITFTPEGKKAILNKLIEGEGFEKFAAARFVGTKRFGLDGGEVHDPRAGADHQARRPAGREGDRARHGPSRPAERARQCDGQALSPAVPRIPGRRRQSLAKSKARAT